MIGIIAGLRGQALASLGTAPGEDSAPAHRCLAGPESVATLADQHTGLKSALHGMNSIVRMDRICRGCIRAATRSVNDAADRPNNDFTAVSHLGDWLPPGSDATYPGECGVLGRRDGQSQDAPEFLAREFVSYAISYRGRQGPAASRREHDAETA